jgi:hypothetical protein
MKRLPWLTASQRRFFKLVIASLRNDPGQWHHDDGWMRNKTLKVRVWYKGDLYKAEIIHNGRRILPESRSPLFAFFQPWRKILQNYAIVCCKSIKYLELYYMLHDRIGHDAGLLDAKHYYDLRTRCGEMLVKSLMEYPEDWVYDGDCNLYNGHVGVKIWVWRLDSAAIHVDVGSSLARKTVIDSQIGQMVQDAWRKQFIKTLKKQIANRTIRILDSKYDAFTEYEKLLRARDSMKKERLP